LPIPPHPLVDGRRRRHRRPSFRLLLQRCELTLPFVVQLGLRDDALSEDPQGSDQSVELVQRVGATRLRVDLELEIDPVAAVGDFENDARLEVVRAALAVLVAVRVVLQTAVCSVLDVREDVRASVEAG
jgi:hypothetical protein